MLLINQLPLSVEDAGKIRNWLSQETANVVIGILERQLAGCEAKAANAMAKIPEQPGMKGDMEDALTQAIKLRNCIEVLTNVKENAGGLTLTEVSVGNGLSINFARIGPNKGA